MNAENPAARPPERRFPLALRLLAVPVVAALVVLGVWVAGGVVSDDFRVSRAATALWLGAAAVAAVLVARRWRPLAVPVLATFVVTATAIGAYLGYATLVDKVAEEDVVRAGVQGSSELAAGTFTSAAHETTGRAAVVRLADGRRLLTLTRFETDAGPDLRVYVATGGADELGEYRDLGALKGNKGDQQYVLPSSVDVRRYSTVVIWCRAFSVAFGTARLAAS